jgi:hypothetical protein
LTGIENDPKEKVRRRKSMKINKIQQTAVVLALMVLALLVQVSCASKAIPVTTPTLKPTATPTATATVSAGLVIFDDSLHVATGESEFDGGGGAVTGSDLANTDAPYAGTGDAMWFFSNCGGGGYVGWNVTGPATDLSAYTTLSFRAKTSRAYTGNGIEFFGGGNSMTNHLFAVTTTYALYSYTFNQPSNNTTVLFGVVINTADVSDLPGAGPVTVYVDNIQYQ